MLRKQMLLTKFKLSYLNVFENWMSKNTKNTNINDLCLFLEF